VKVLLVFNQRNHSCYYNQALFRSYMSPISVKPRCNSCPGDVNKLHGSFKQDEVIENKKSTAKAGAIENYQHHFHHFLALDDGFFLCSITRE
jgi:hypothetical protein